MGPPNLLTRYTNLRVEGSEANVSAGKRWGLSLGHRLALRYLTVPTLAAPALPLDYFGSIGSARLVWWTFSIKGSPAHYGRVFPGNATNKGIDARSATAIQNICGTKYIHGVACGFATQATAG